MTNFVVYRTTITYIFMKKKDLKCCTWILGCIFKLKLSLKTHKEEK